jgi:hypothetical protein
MYRNIKKKRQREKLKTNLQRRPLGMAGTNQIINGVGNCVRRSSKCRRPLVAQEREKMRATLKCNRHRDHTTHPHLSPAAMELQKNAHKISKGKKRNGLKTKAAIMESITSLLKRSLNRAWVYHYSRSNLFITNKIRIFSLNEFFLGFHGSNISSSASTFQTVKFKVIK